MTTNYGLEEFANDVQNLVAERAPTNPSREDLERAFTEWVVNELSERNFANEAEPIEFQAGSRGPWPAAKLNAWAMSGDSANLDLFVTRYHGDGAVHTLGKPEARRQFELLLGFLKRARERFHKELDERNDVKGVAETIYGAVDSLATVRLFLLTDGVAKAEDIEVVELEGLDVQYVLWDIKKLSQLQVGEHAAITLDFEKDYGGALPCISSGKNSEYETYLAFMPGNALARIYGDHGQRLLERNVRAFLQVRGNVNKGLQSTLGNEPTRFLAYNNGLCCTAAEVEVLPHQNGGMAIAWAKDFQIVNGGQTTASIFHAKRKERFDVSDVVVQVKLTVLSLEKSVEMVPLIAKYANSQNKVNAADLAANGKFHQDLERMSREIWAPATTGLGSGTHWYYERARGSYLDDKARQRTPAARREWEKHNPSQQKFTKTDMAKYEHAWLGKPDLVCLGAEKNFVRFAEALEDEGVPEVHRDYFQQLIAKKIIWRAAETLFDTLGLRGYRANSVAYAVAWVAKHSEYRIDLERVWREQHIPPGLHATLKCVCNAAWQHLNGQPGNVGEASKKPECYESFRAMAIALPPDWLSELSEKQFIISRSAEDELSKRWEHLRRKFIVDSRSVGDLEALTNKSCGLVVRQPISGIACLSWEELRQKRRMRIKKIRSLLEMLAIAAEDPSG